MPDHATREAQQDDELYEAPKDVPRDEAHGHVEQTEDPHWTVHPDLAAEKCAKHGDTSCPSPLEYAAVQLSIRSLASAFKDAGAPRPTTFTASVAPSAKPNERVTPMRTSMALAELATLTKQTELAKELTGTLAIEIDARLGVVATLHGTYRDPQRMTRHQESELHALIFTYGMEVFFQGWHREHASKPA